MTDAAPEARTITIIDRDSQEPFITEGQAVLEMRAGLLEEQMTSMEEERRFLDLIIEQSALGSRLAQLYAAEVGRRGRGERVLSGDGVLLEVLQEGCTDYFADRAKMMGKETPVTQAVYHFDRLREKATEQIALAEKQARDEGESLEYSLRQDPHIVIVRFKLDLDEQINSDFSVVPKNWSKPDPRAQAEG